MSIIAEMFFLIAIIVIVIFLQIYLSRTKKRWIGLTLPTISLLLAIIITIVLQPVFHSTTITETITDENGEIVSEVVHSTPNELTNDIPSTIFTLIITFVLWNIPTLILLGIYVATRDKIKKNAEIEKMNIMDLQ